jgi:hypothetical protein
MSNKGNVALVEWDLGGSSMVAFDKMARNNELAFWYA